MRDSECFRGVDSTVCFTNKDSSVGEPQCYELRLDDGRENANSKAEGVRQCDEEIKCELRGLHGKNSELKVLDTFPELQVT